MLRSGGGGVQLLWAPVRFGGGGVQGITNYNGNTNKCHGVSLIIKETRTNVTVYNLFTKNGEGSE